MNIAEISDEMLSDVTGGVHRSGASIITATIKNDMMPFSCRNESCGNTFYIKLEASDVECPKCHFKYQIRG